MQEAWFLFDEPAIRAAAENPHGTQPLGIPALGQLEALPDPKTLLVEILKRASGLQGRHLERFKHRRAAHRLAELIDDFSPLRTLSAFRAYEAAAQASVAAI